MEDDELLYDVYGDLETFDMGEKLKEVCTLLCDF